MMKLMKYLLAIIATLFGLYGFAQNVHNLLTTDSIQYILSMDYQNGNSYISWMKNSESYSIKRVGDCSITKQTANGNIAWEVPFVGKSIITEIVETQGNIFAIGQTKTTTYVGNDSLTINSFFVTKFDANGNLVWKWNTDTLMGDFAQLAVLPNQSVLVACHSKLDPRGYLFEITPQNHVLKRKQLDWLLLTDLDINATGELVTTGFCLQGNIQLDTINATVPSTFDYPTFVAKHSSSLIAQWINFYPYITADDHVKVKWVDEGVAVFNRVSFNHTTLIAKLRYLDHSGTQTAELNLGEFNYNRGELAVIEDEIIFAQIPWHSPATFTPDTLLIKRFNTQLQELEVTPIIADLMYNHEDMAPFKLAYDSCHLVIGSHFYSAAIQVGEDTITGSSNASDVLVSTLSFCQTVSSISVIEELQISVFPNPVIDRLHITLISSSPSILTITDMTGREVLRNTISNSTIDLPFNMPSGTYILNIQTEVGIARELFIVE